MNAMNRLLEIMRTLRGPDGCDWDKQQTPESLKRYVIEEAYELLDTIDGLRDSDDIDAINHHKEELGDVLLQVVFLSQIQAEHSHFDFDAVALAIVEKMERRHPHIFGDAARDPSVKGNPYWHAVKETEANKNANVFQSIAKGQPALMRAYKLGERVARLNFDWRNAHDALKKIREEIDELEEALDANDLAHAHEELGDLLFAIAQVARHVKIDPELALHQGNEKFIHRFDKLLHLAGGADELKKLDLDRQSELWEKIKA